MKRPKIYIIDSDDGKGNLYWPWLSRINLPYRIEPKLTKTPKDAVLIVTHHHYKLPAVQFLRRTVLENRVPILILADGILEYRNTWQHPALPDGSMFQPLLGHKFAAIGRSQARIIESWGNSNKCEIVGLPKCDQLMTRQPRIRKASDPFRVLVATARTPGFDDQQLHAAEKSLRDVKKWFDHVGKQSNCVPIWRLTNGLDRKIDVPQAEFDSFGDDFYQLIDHIDAVVSTTSTLLLEVALTGRPSVQLDYNNTPHYLPLAWNVTAQNQIHQVMTEIQKPPMAKMIFQNQILHDSLECQSPATSRLIHLVAMLYDAGKLFHSENLPVMLPARMLDSVTPLPGWKNDSVPLSDLFPKNPTFRNYDVSSLQVELNHLVDENARLAKENKKLAATNQKLSRINQKLRNRSSHRKAA